MFLLNHPLLLVVFVLVIIGMVAASKAVPAAKKGSRPIHATSASKEVAPPQVQSAEREFAQTKVLTDAEVKFFRQLQVVLTDELIFPQVAMSALIKPTGRGKQYWSSFGKISQKRVDFAIYRKDLSLVAVIELDDPSHDRRGDDDLQRDAYLRSAGVRTVRFDVRKWPDDATIRGKLYPGTSQLPAMRASAPAMTAAAVAAPPAPSLPRASDVTQGSQSA